MIVWACMATNGTGSVVFINDVSVDRSSTVNYIQAYTLCSHPAKCCKTDRKVLHRIL